MSITRFDDIPNLIGYWSAVESVINKTGDIVSSVEPAYPGVGNTLVTRADRTHEIFHDGTTKIGNCLAFYDNTGSNSNSALHWQEAAYDTSARGLTVVSVELRTSTSSISMSFAAHDSGTIRQTVEQTSGFYRARSSHETFISAIGVTLDPTVMIYQLDGTNLTLHIKNNSVDTSELLASDALNYTVDDMYWMGTHNNYNLRGGASLLAVYDRGLDAQEILDVKELAQYWLDFGEAPGLEFPISDSFGPLTTNQDGNVTSWKWQESSDNANWQDVGTILTDTTGQDTNTLTVNRGTVAMHGTYVRCEAKTATQTAYSSSAQVLIDGQ